MKLHKKTIGYGFVIMMLIIIIIGIYFNHVISGHNLGNTFFNDRVYDIYLRIIISSQFFIVLTTVSLGLFLNEKEKGVGFLECFSVKKIIQRIGLKEYLVQLILFSIIVGYSYYSSVLIVNSMDNFGIIFSFLAISSNKFIFWYIYFIILFTVFVCISSILLSARSVELKSYKLGALALVLCGIVLSSRFLYITPLQNIIAEKVYFSEIQEICGDDYFSVGYINICVSGQIKHRGLDVSGEEDIDFSKYTVFNGNGYPQFSISPNYLSYHSKYSTVYYSNINNSRIDYFDNYSIGLNKDSEEVLGNIISESKDIVLRDLAYISLLQFYNITFQKEKALTAMINYYINERQFGVSKESVFRGLIRSFLSYSHPDLINSFLSNTNEDDSMLMKEELGEGLSNGSNISGRIELNGLAYANRKIGLLTPMDGFCEIGYIGTYINPNGNEEIDLSYCGNLYFQKEGGGNDIRLANSTTTDELGNFEFNNVGKGIYYIILGDFHKKKKDLLEEFIFAEKAPNGIDVDNENINVGEIILKTVKSEKALLDINAIFVSTIREYCQGDKECLENEGISYPDFDYNEWYSLKYESSLPYVQKLEKKDE